MTSPRILQFITPAGFYGAERWILALANNMPPDAATCDLAVSDEGGSQDLSMLELYPESLGRVHRVNMRGRFDWRVISRICRIIRDRRIDVIHTHGYKSDILGFIAAKRMGIKCVSTPHGFSGNVGFKLATFIRLGTFMLRFFDMVAPLSDELVADMRRFGVPERKTRFIRNGVDLKEIDQVLEGSRKRETKSEAGKRSFTIGFIGQLIPRKGIGDLLTVFDQLCVDFPYLQLRLIGDGSQRSELESIAAGLPCAKKIQFLGFRSDRLTLLQDIDLFVMTSSLEGIPRCMMEAMAVGVPVVAYNISGVDQLVEHGKTGLLAPHGDKSALQENCRRLIDDPKLAKRLLANARDLIDDQYSAARMATEYEGLYLQLLHRDRLTKSSKGSVL